MPIFNGWLIRALAGRLRQPGMRAQRRFMLVICLVLALFLAAAVTFLWRQETEAALEAAALKVFAATGALIVVVISAAVVVRKRTGARWTTEEALGMAGEGKKAGPAQGPRGAGGTS